MTFVEVLVTVVIMGTVVVATMAALNVSIRASDQHKSRVGALADLEGVAAYLNRVAQDDPAADCDPATPDASVFNNYILDASASGQPLADGNPGVTVEALGPVSCAGGVAELTLRATHAKENAAESLRVTVGGITVLENGAMSPLPPVGACQWNSFTVDNPNPTLKNSGRLASTVTVTLDYAGDCSAASAMLTFDAQGYPATSEPMNPDGGTAGGQFEFTFAKNHFDPWYEGVVDLNVSTSDGHVDSSYFTVVPS